MEMKTTLGNDDIGVPVNRGQHQQIINDILKIAFGPLLLRNKIDQIINRLLSTDSLQLGPHIGIFFTEKDSNLLVREVSTHVCEKTTPLCTSVQPGICHCGSTAQTRVTTFFSTSPPLFAEKEGTIPFFGNYIIPITSDGQFYGLLTVYVKENHSYSKNIEQLLEIIGSILAGIFENHLQDQQLIDLVNDLRKSIVSLREEKKFSESIIQGLNHGLIVADLDGTIRKSNSVAKSIFHSSPTPLEGRNLFSIIDRKAAQKLLTINDSGREQQKKELSFSGPGGEERILRYSNVAREDATGRTVGVIISLSDISELKYIRKEMAKMNRLSTVAEIASAVAHEVRNPLAGIKIMAQSIEEEAKDNSEQLECSQRIIRQVDRLNELLTDFFSYARPVVPNKRPVSLMTIIAETLPLINNRLTKKQIYFSSNIGHDLPPVIADPHQVQQVFLNLFLNAIDAIMEQGEITLTAERLSFDKLHLYKKNYPGLLVDDHRVVVHFRDNGSGMPPEVAEQVFEPFFTTKTSGAGLGLSIVYRTLKENDAAIVLESKTGKGTTFTIFFRAEI
ncbi:ATP-binding protein [Desulfomarina sp.]